MKPHPPPSPGVAAIAAFAVALGIATSSLAADKPSRADALARFDAGYAQCEQRHAEMRGQRDRTYAALYRLRDDEQTRAQLQRLRDSAEYKAASRRASRALARQAAASDVSSRLDQQCRALQREAAR